MLLVGLGNPGPQYARTRHNMGFWVLDRVAGRLGVRLTKPAFHGTWAQHADDGVRLGLLKPQGFMNCSGEAVGECARYWKIDPSEILVAHDDLDLRLGQMKLAHDRGAAGHNGVASVTEHLGTQAYWRLRIGIGRPQDGEDSVEYVLTPFAKDEWAAVDTVVEQAADAMQMWYREGPRQVMQTFHTKATDGGSDGTA